MSNRLNKALNYILLLSIFVFQTVRTVQVYAYSKLGTTVVLPRAGTAKVVAYPYPGRSTLAPSAQWIWNSYGNQSTCDMEITIQATFNIKCPGYPLTVCIMADNFINFTLGTATGGPTGGWTDCNNYTVDTTGLACNTAMTFRASGLNYANQAPKCNGNPAALFFAITSDSCDCSTGYFLSNCVCYPCYDYLDGCLACTSSTTCTSCNTNYKYTLVSGKCACMTGYIKSLGCLACIKSGTACPACDSNKNFYLNGTVCSCKSGYTLVNSVCTVCSNLLSNCATCSSSTVCTSCNNTGMAIYNNVCVTCSTPLEGCLTCSSSTICLTCVTPTYLLSGTRCSKCSVYISGCTQCSSSTICLACDGTLNFFKSGSTCSCTTGYTKVGTSCVTCNSTLLGCTACTTQSTCTSCNAVLYFSLSGSSCVCQTGYFLQSTSCVLCSTQLVGCSSCTSSSVCTTCNTAGRFYLTGSRQCACNSGYALNTVTKACNTCSSFIAGCSTCSSSSSCLTAQAGYALNASNVPQTCSSAMQGCLTCATLAQCSSCDSTLHYSLSGNSCVCASGYVLNGTTCSLCSGYISGCNVCTNQATCIQCQDTYYVDSGACSSCSTVLNGCTRCSNALSCTQCNTTQHLTYNNATLTCDCDPSSYYQAGVGCKACELDIAGCELCTSASACDSCFKGYLPINTITCTACQTLMSNCYECDTSTHCSSCLDGYAFDNSGSCAACSTFLQGCSQCSDSSTCTKCNTANLYLQSPLLGQCQCQTDYVLQNSGCSNCQAYEHGCLHCNTADGCTECDTALFMELDSGRCSCVQHYTRSSGSCVSCSSVITGCDICSSDTVCGSCLSTYGIQGNTCMLCSVAISYCLDCNQASTCLVCATGYAPQSGGRCQNCSYFLPDCLECSGNSTCTNCNGSGVYLDSSTSTCKACSTLIVGCLTCTGNQNTLQCTTCNAARRFETYYGICMCQSGYIVNDTSCVTCGQVMSGCIACTSKDSCSTCADAYFLASGQCIACTLGCISCHSLDNCLECSSVHNFQLDEFGKSCQCVPGMQVARGSSECTAICGDGTRFASTEQCDDGNTIQFDGCSPNCLLQKDYSCLDYVGQPSICSPTRPFQFKINKILNMVCANKVIFEFQVSPNLRILSRIRFSDAFVPDNDTLHLLTSSDYSFSENGVLQISFDYFATLENQRLSFMFNPAAQDTHFFATLPTNYTFYNISSNTSARLQYSSKEQCASLTNIKKSLDVGQVLVYVVLLVCVVTNKIVGVELVGMWQLAYLSLGSLGKVPFNLSPLLKMNTLFGINNQLPWIATLTDVPSRIATVSFSSSVLHNFNYMFQALLSLFALGLTVYSIGNTFSFPGPKRATIIFQTIKKIGLHLLKQFSLMLLLFNLFNMSYSSGLYFAFGTSHLQQDIIAVSVLLIAILAGFSVILTDAQGYGEYRQYMKPVCQSQAYFLFAIVYRLATGFALAYFNETQKCVFLGVCFSVAFLSYQAINLPYKEGYQNMRALLVQISNTVLLCSIAYLRIMGDSLLLANPNSGVEEMLALLIIVLMMFSLTVSILVLSYELYRKTVSLVMKNFKNQESFNTETKQGRSRLGEEIKDSQKPKILFSQSQFVNNISLPTEIQNYKPECL